MKNLFAHIIIAKVGVLCAYNENTGSEKAVFKQGNSLASAIWLNMYLKMLYSDFLYCCR